MWPKSVVLIVSLCSTSISVANTIYGYLFITDWRILSTTTVNYKPQWSKNLIILPFPLLNNVALIALFSLVHSGLARNSVRSFLLSKCMFSSEAIYRCFYAICSSVLIFLIMLLWTPIPGTIWSIEGSPLIFYLILTVRLLSWIMLGVSLSFINAIQFGGAEPLMEFLIGWQSNKSTELITTGLYGIVRHPVYFFMLGGFWLAPTMTVGHLVLCTSFTTYVVLAVKLLEERKLIEEFGYKYVQYQKKVPYQFIPYII